MAETCHASGTPSLPHGKADDVRCGTRHSGFEFAGKLQRCCWLHLAIGSRPVTAGSTGSMTRTSSLGPADGCRRVWTTVRAGCGCRRIVGPRCLGRFGQGWTRCRASPARSSNCRRGTETQLAKCTARGREAATHTRPCCPRTTPVHRIRCRHSCRPAGPWPASVETGDTLGRPYGMHGALGPNRDLRP